MNRRDFLAGATFTVVDGKRCFMMEQCNGKISQEACLKIGGHCWQSEPVSQITIETCYDMISGQMISCPNQPQDRICKHCGRREALNIIPERRLWEEMK